MKFTELIDRVSCLRFAGVKPQADGLFPMAVTQIEFDTLLKDQMYQIATVGHGHRPSAFIEAPDYITCVATGVAFYIVSQETGALAEDDLNAAIDAARTAFHEGSKTTMARSLPDPYANQIRSFQSG